MILVGWFNNKNSRINCQGSFMQLIDFKQNETSELVRREY